MLRTRARRGPTPSTRSESITLALGIAGATAGLLVGLIALRGTAPLSGEGSIGQVAGVSALVTSGLVGTGALLVLTPRRHPWMRKIPWWRRALAITGPALVYAVLAFLLTSAMFAVLQQAFLGVALDRFAGTFWVSVTTGIWAYVVGASAAALNGRSLATLLMVFLTVGVLAAALLAPDPSWWQRFFSQLGASSDRAGTTFNLTLALTGLAFVTVGDFLAHDLGRWARAAGEPWWKVQVVRGTLVVLGLLLVLVAVISLNVSEYWHNVAAESLVVVFGLALIVFPVLLHRLPGGLLVFTGLAFAILVMLIVLFEGVGYLNMTAFEMGAAATVYVWLLLLIRAVSAAGEGTAEVEPEALSGGDVTPQDSGTAGTATE
ncbi:hypothetical protein [Brachybacterium sp. FME24]|uniref:hypothetical protein n=1 Tax=Brachybacterium sp. FME24 TaxID=2742605 RepID=UPI001867D18C|nr:hypothetical protein [Brachybacterium sp. FME24]